jgi:GT2 family glycosyltransferase
MEAAQADDAIGMLGAVIYAYSQPNKVQYSGWKINWNTGDFTEYPQANSIEYAQKLGVHEVDALQGGALLVRSDVVKEIGFMDEDFFMYYEETDWCLRTKKAGYKLVIVSGAKVWHKGYHSTGGKDSPFQLYFQVRSRFLLMKKHNTFKDWIIFAPIFLATFVLNKTVVFLFTYLKTGNKVNLKKVAAIFKGLLDFYTHNYGPGPKWVQIH